MVPVSWLTYILFTKLICALNLHLICTNKVDRALNMVLFVMLWCWCCSLNSSQIAQLEDAVFYYDSKFAQNILQIHPNSMKMCLFYITGSRKLVQLRYYKSEYKGAGTKIHKCLVRYQQFGTNHEMKWMKTIKIVKN